MKLSFRDNNKISAIQTLVPEVFKPTKEDLYKHPEPTQVISPSKESPNEFRDEIRTIKKELDESLEGLFQALGKRFEEKEISGRFWETIPVDIRAKYKEKVEMAKEKLRNFYQKRSPESWKRYLGRNPRLKNKQPIQIQGL